VIFFTSRERKEKNKNKICENPFEGNTCFCNWFHTIEFFVSNSRKVW
jgi:hypothetical protein